MMTSLERRRKRVNEALRQADDILTRQDECHFRLKVGDSFDRLIVPLSDNGRPLTESQLRASPVALQEAWSSLVGSRLLRIAIYYRLLFLDEILGGGQESGLPASWPREDTLTLGIYDMTDRLNSQKAANEAFADAVDVYISRLEEVDPKRAARLRRAIKAGCLEANADELFIGGEEDWLPWVIAGQMPRREDFDDNDLTSDFHFNDQDPEFRRSRALGEGMGRGIAAALTDFVISTQKDYGTEGHPDEADDDVDKTRGIKRLFEFAKPVVNVYAFPTFGEFALMCAAGTMIVCVVLIGFRLLRLL